MNPSEHPVPVWKDNLGRAWQRKNLPKEKKTGKVSVSDRRLSVMKVFGKEIKILGKRVLGEDLSAHKSPKELG